MSSNDLRSSLRCIRQSLCAIAGIWMLDWAISLLGWAGEKKIVTSLSVVCAGFATEDWDKGKARVYRSSQALADMPVGWYWDAERTMCIHGPFDSREKANADARMLGHTTG